MRTDEGSRDDDAAQMLRGIGLERKSSSRERGAEGESPETEYDELVWWG